MNRLITVNSYTMLASTLTIAIAKKLMMLMTALLVSQSGEEEAPAGLRLARPGPLTQPAVVGEGACSIAFSQITFRLYRLVAHSPFWDLFDQARDLLLWAFSLSLDDCPCVLNSR